MIEITTSVDQFGEKHYFMTLPANVVVRIAMATDDDNLTSTLRSALARSGVDDVGAGVFFDTTPIALDLVATEAAEVSSTLQKINSSGG